MKRRVTAASVQAGLTIFRDLTLWVGGLAGIAYQQLTGQVNGELLVVYTSMLGIPGVIGLVQLSRGKGEPRPTPEESSSPQSSSSSW